MNGDQREEADHFSAVFRFQQELREKGISGVGAMPIIRDFDKGLREMRAMDAAMKRTMDIINDREHREGG